MSPAPSNEFGGQHTAGPATTGRQTGSTGTVASHEVSDAVGPSPEHDDLLVDAAIRSVTANVHDIGTDQLADEAGRAASRPRRSYGWPARGLFRLLDTVYGPASTVEKFRVLELVARVPYQAWEQVAFVAITHTHEDPMFARKVHDRVGDARAQQDNEFYHLLIMEELLDRRGFRRSLLRGRVLPQVIAFAYYHLSWLLYAIRPRFSHALNADFEDHAMHTYLEYVADNPSLESTPWTSEFRNEYGPYDTVADLFRSIALDERRHRDDSEASIERARFGSEADADPQQQTVPATTLPRP